MAGALRLLLDGWPHNHSAGINCGVVVLRRAWRADADAGDGHGPAIFGGDSRNLSGTAIRGRSTPGRRPSDRRPASHQISRLEHTERDQQQELPTRSSARYLDRVAGAVEPGVMGEDATGPSRWAPISGTRWSRSGTRQRRRCQREHRRRFQPQRADQDQRQVGDHAEVRDAQQRPSVGEAMVNLALRIRRDQQQAQQRNHGRQQEGQRAGAELQLECSLHNTRVRGLPRVAAIHAIDAPAPRSVPAALERSWNLNPADRS